MLDDQAEVQDLDTTSGGEHDIGRFQVPVDNPAAMRFFQRFSHFPGQTEELVSSQGSPGDLVSERRTRDVLHGDKVMAIGITRQVRPHLCRQNVGHHWQGPSFFRNNTGS